MMNEIYENYRDMRFDLYKAGCKYMDSGMFDEAKEKFSILAYMMEILNYNAALDKAEGQS